MNEYWSIYPRYGNFGVELYLRMTREQKTTFNVLVAQTEIDQATAITLEKLRGRLESEASSPEREMKIWQSCYRNWDLAKAMLLERMTPREKHLAALLTSNASWHAQAASAPDFKGEATVMPEPLWHQAWLKNGRFPLDQENQPLNDEILEVINENCG
jgi:hypothetical protein